MAFINLWRDSTQLDNSFLAHQGSEFREKSQCPFITNSNSLNARQKPTTSRAHSPLPLWPHSGHCGHPSQCPAQHPRARGHASIMETGEGSAQTGA